MIARGVIKNSRTYAKDATRVRWVATRDNALHTPNPLLAFRRTRLFGQMAVPKHYGSWIAWKTKNR